MQCPACSSENLTSQHFCGDCGQSLSEASVRVGRQIDRHLAARLKDHQLVEYEITDRIVKRLESWAKIGGWVFAGASFIFAVTVGFLTWFGVSKYTSSLAAIESVAKSAESRIKDKADVLTGSMDTLEYSTTSGEGATSPGSN